MTNKKTDHKFYIPDEKTIDAVLNQGHDATKKLLLELTNTVKELVVYVEKQNKIIQNLSDRINKNSDNSDKPPSSDGLNKKSKQTKSLRRKSNKKSGGQPGHKGHTLSQSTNVDKAEIHPVTQCDVCQNSLQNVDVDKIEKRQIFDLPPITIEITEHQAEIKTCPFCGHKNKGDFPEEATSPVQYGKMVKSVINYFTNYHFVPIKRTTEIFNDLFSHPISEATVLKANRDQEKNINPAIQSIKEYLINSKILHVDESGIRKEGELNWIHSASNQKATCYGIHKNRGKIAMDDIGILEEFTGILIHDFWKSYFKYKNAKHSICNAHILRELKFIAENYKQKWAKYMFQHLLDIKNKVEQVRKINSHFTEENINHFERKYDEIIKEGYFLNNQLTNNRKPVNLLGRLEDYKKEVLLFMHNFEVPFDNNQGERDIRMTKIKQKISGSFRTQTGADNFANIRSYISTIIKNSKNVLDELFNANCGNPFIMDSANF
jgi:transposase